MTTVSQDICGCLLVVTKNLQVVGSAFIAALIVGCVYLGSWDDVMGSWVGHPISDIEKLYGAPNGVILRSDSQKEYKYHLKKIDSSCIHYWIVNPQGIIVDYRYEGRCRPIG